MSSRWRQILPSGSMLGLFIAVYAGIEAFDFVLRLLYGVPSNPIIRLPNHSHIAGLRCIWSVSRDRFHPAWRAGYCRWLQSTPWAHPAPLPLGPVHLIWQDAIVILPVVGLILRNPERPWAMALTVFIISYLVALGVAMMMTRQTRIGWALLFVPGLAFRFEQPTYILVACLPFYVLGCVGLRRSLRTFPWDIDKYWRSGQPGLPAQNDPNKPKLGWPYLRLQPFELKRVIDPETGIALGLLTAWYLSAFGQYPNDPESQLSCWQFSTMIAAGAGIGRLGVYVAGHHPPISLLGRLFTGRLIIPGYDRVLLAPAASLLAGLLLPRILTASGVPWSVTYPLGAGVALALALNLPPTLATWRLTGSHRLAMGLDASNNLRI